MDTVTIHQPNYLPWIGFFSKLKKADTFVLLDTVEYTKNSVINRNKIRIKDGWCYLTIPIEKAYHDSRIIDVALPKDDRWKKNHWSTIEANYGKTLWFKGHTAFFKEVYEKDYRFLWEINEDVIRYIMDCFGIKTKILKASELSIDPSLRKTDLILDILKKTGAKTYLSGPSGREYLEQDRFADEKILLEFFEYKHPQYNQRYAGFVPNLSAIDLLFNMGGDAKEMI
jgi:hypothetical protein